MSWIVDNATSIYILLGVIAAGLIAFFWLDKRLKFLFYAVGVLALIGLVWLLTMFLESDRKQLTNSVLAMRDAVVAGDVDELFEHISEDFRYEFPNQNMTRAQLFEAAQLVMQRGKVGNINITKFHVEEVSREHKTARVKFTVTPFDANGELLRPFVTQAEFVLEGERWKLKSMDFFEPFVNTDQKIGIPGL